MEGLIAALVGWITTSEEVINLQTGLRIRNTGDEIESRAEIVYPSGDTEEYIGADADLIFDRTETLAAAAEALTLQLNVIAAQAAAAVQTGAETE